MNLKILSQSIVMIDKQCSSSSLTSGFYNPNQNPFQDLNSSVLLKRVVKDITKDTLDHRIIDNPPMSKQFIFTKRNEFLIEFLYESSPSKFTITQKNININDSQEYIKKIFTEIIDANIKTSIGSVGINYELFLEKKCNVKDFLLKDNVAKECNGVNITIVYKYENNANINLTIAGAEIDEKSGVYFNINCDNMVTDDNNIDNILAIDFQKIVSEKISSIGF